MLSRSRSVAVFVGLSFVAVCARAPRADPDAAAGSESTAARDAAARAEPRPR